MKKCLKCGVTTQGIVCRGCNPETSWEEEAEKLIDLLPSKTPEKVGATQDN